MSQREASGDGRVAISFRDLSGALFRLFLTAVSFLAWNYCNQITGSIEEVRRALAEQNTRIALIELTTRRTEKLVEQDNAAIRLNADRLTKLESRVK